MRTVDKLDVYMSGRRVGTMAAYERYRTAFEYASEWIMEGYSISPFSLPLRSGVQFSKWEPFQGLFGVFHDSLPDGWGQLLVDRMLRRLGEDPAAVGVMERLAIAGDAGRGALEYRPVYPMGNSVTMAGTEDMDLLSAECEKILESEEMGDLDMLYALGGSSGGARPKVLVTVDREDWIVKFPSSVDPKDIGEMEHRYMQCAAECGIQVPEYRLFPSRLCAGYFGVRRFDRPVVNGRRTKLHMASASALLEVSHRIPALDYNTLMALTWQLTKQQSEMERMFRLMCFNVFSHNRDDHSNNFSFLCEEGNWRLSPAYDLTYSNSLGGEHATTVDGEGRSPGFDDVMRVARKAGIPEARAREIAGEVREKTTDRLGRYLGDSRMR